MSLPAVGLPVGPSVDCGAATGAPVEIGKKPGEKWKAYKGEILGKTIHVKPNKMIVQTWRVKGWDKATPDSVLTLRLVDTKDGCEVTMGHGLLLDAAALHVKKGWNKMYWSKFKKYLKATR